LAASVRSLGLTPTDSRFFAARHGQYPVIGRVTVRFHASLKSVCPALSVTNSVYRNTLFTIIVNKWLYVT